MSVEQPQTIEHIGQAIRQMRIERGWTQSALAERVNKAPEAISMLETGRKGWTNMTLDTLGLFSAAFNVQPADLISMISTTVPGDTDAD